MRNQLLENDITPSRRERFLREGIFGIQCHIPSDGISPLFYFLNHFIIPTGLSFFARFWGFVEGLVFFRFCGIGSALTLTLLLVQLVLFVPVV